MIVSIFYTNKRFREVAVPLRERLTELKFDRVLHYTREWLETTDFYSENKEILDMPKGDGYWLWKPFIILETMKTLKDGDVVFYTDAGDNIHDKEILNIIGRSLFRDDYVLSSPRSVRMNKHYTKADCFILMGCDSVGYWNNVQVEAGTVVFKKTPAMLAFLNEWLHLCRNKNIVTDIPNEYGDNYDGFRFHRHDQSVLSLLAAKHKMSRSEELYSCINHNFVTP